MVSKIGSLLTLYELGVAGGVCVSNMSCIRCEICRKEAPEATQGAANRAKQQ